MRDKAAIVGVRRVGSTFARAIILRKGATNFAVASASAVPAAIACAGLGEDGRAGSKFDGGGP